MASKRNPVGHRTADRLAARSRAPQLSRQTLPGGGEVFRGPLATRALKALGARAMTLDRSIVVGDDFDYGRPEDQALYAHERVHVEQGHDGGGGGGVGLHDAEEVAARAAESAVLSRAMTGGYEAGYKPGAGSLGDSDGHRSRDRTGSGVAAGTQSAEEKPEDVNRVPNAERGYWKLREMGYSHDDVVFELARKVVGAIDERAEVGADRKPPGALWR